MLSILRKRKEIFSPAERQNIISAIQQAEQRTSGEVRVFIENRCRFVNAIDRAMEIFQNLKMDQTKDRNAVLLYVAIKDRQLAILGDEGIHKKVGSEYWTAEVAKMIKAFNRDDCPNGIIQCVHDIGEALYQHFPYDRSTDKNELPDDIIFGR